MHRLMHATVAPTDAVIVAPWAPSDEPTDALTVAPTVAPSDARDCGTD